MQQFYRCGRAPGADVDDIIIVLQARVEILQAHREVAAQLLFDTAARTQLLATGALTAAIAGTCTVLARRRAAAETVQGRQP